MQKVNYFFASFCIGTKQICTGTKQRSQREGNSVKIFHSRSPLAAEHSHTHSQSRHFVLRGGTQRRFLACDIKQGNENINISFSRVRIDPQPVAFTIARTSVRVQPVVAHELRLASIYFIFNNYYYKHYSLMDFSTISNGIDSIDIVFEFCQVENFYYK